MILMARRDGKPDAQSFAQEESNRERSNRERDERAARRGPEYKGAQGAGGSGRNLQAGSSSSNPGAGSRMCQPLVISKFKWEKLPLGDGASGVVRQARCEPACSPNAAFVRAHMQPLPMRCTGMERSRWQ